MDLTLPHSPSRPLQSTWSPPAPSGVTRSSRDHPHCVPVHSFSINKPLPPFQTSTCRSLCSEHSSLLLPGYLLVPPDLHKGHLLPQHPQAVSPGWVPTTCIVGVIPVRALTHSGHQNHLVPRPSFPLDRWGREAHSELPLASPQALGGGLPRRSLTQSELTNAGRSEVIQTVSLEGQRWPTHKPTPQLRQEALPRTSQWLTPSEGWQLIKHFLFTSCSGQQASCQIQTEREK